MEDRSFIILSKDVKKACLEICNKNEAQLKELLYAMELAHQELRDELTYELASRYQIEDLRSRGFNIAEKKSQ